MFIILTSNFKLTNTIKDISNNNQMADLLKVSEIELVPNIDNLNVFIDGIDITFEIREPLVSNNVSLVASHKDVRSIMTEKQRN